MEFEIYNEDCEKFVQDASLQCGEEYTVMRSILFHRALSKMDDQNGALVDQSKRNRYNSNFDAMTFMSHLSNEEFLKRAKEANNNNNNGDDCWVTNVVVSSRSLEVFY